MTLLLAAGAALRLFYVSFTESRALGEAYNVAAALADGRGFADAYHAGQGATAHVTPITPGIAAAVYSIFGTGSVVSETILGCWSIGLALATYFLLYGAFGRLGVPAILRLGALAFLCLVPVYFWPETVDFRVWDGGLAACLTALLFNRMMATQEISVRQTWPLAVIAALLFFVNPVWGVAGYLCVTIYCLARVPLTRTFLVAAVAALALVAVVGPWAIRNAIVMDRPVLLRSNSGLELALAMHPAAVDTTDPGGTFMKRLREIHPTMGSAPYRAMKAAGGEASYANELGRETWRWIGAHPAAAATLAVRHIRQAIFPDGWQFSALGGSERGGRLRAYLIRTLATLGVVGIALMLVSRRSSWIYPAILIVVPAMEMAFFQPVQRYTYLSYPLLVFAASGCVMMLIDLRRRRRYQVSSEGMV
ncbi:hypothetical protein ACFSC3_11080 [Sphingomonas floccifaciens]|uniref:Glycosyltransferase RgtA/B/C/D-like domain-containing protein n=1 Tax=Sphingomonas floccifaciens TaxID=1844115 RepID=A0ABW4ND89_9SPHN